MKYLSDRYPWIIYILFLICIIAMLTTNSWAEETNYTYTPSWKATEPKINYVHRPFWKFCGWYNFGHRIILNNVSWCDQEETLRHEMKHYEYFMIINQSERLKYCQNQNIGYNRICWERYVEE